MIKTILIPTDGSDYGNTAIDYGVYIAKRLEARLTGLHVVDIRLLQGPVITDISGSIGLPPYQELYPVIEKGLEDRADVILKAFEERCAQGGIPAETRKAVGIINEAIIEEGKNHDWIILAQRGEHFHITKGGILGSTAEAVVRHAGKPVLVTPQSYQDIESIGLAYDGSPPAQHALELAVFLADKMAWPLTILMVTDDQDRAAKCSKKAETYLEAFQIDCEMIVMGGKEDRAILQFIKEGAVELMVMGAYGRNRLHELFIGSTTSQVIRKSTIPVLLTR
jgi:nucleotide-binding universal stress UspA family protein